MAPATAAAADVVVVVLPVEGAPSEDLQSRLTDYVESRIAEADGYRIFPRAQLEKALVGLQKKSLRAVFDRSTQVEIGKRVTASQTLRTQIIKIGGECRVSLTFFDLTKGVSVDSAGEEAGCNEGQLLGSLRAALGKLDFSKKPKAPLLKVGIRPWGGYVGGLYYNGGLKHSNRSRFKGVKVDFKELHSIEESVRAWNAGEVDVVWITVDDLPTEYDLLASQEPRLFLQTAWSRGEQVLVARSNVRKLNDLKRKRIAFVERTTGHSFLLISLDLAGLRYNQIEPVTARSSKDAAEIFIRGDADAAIVWIDDDKDCLAEVRGAKALESTKDASYLIAESLVVKADTLRKHRDAVVKLAEGWLQANAELNASDAAKKKAVDLMVRAFGLSRSQAEHELSTVRLATHGDNLNFFGMNRNYLGEKGEDLYHYFDKRYGDIYQALNGATPRWSSIADARIVGAISLAGRKHQAEPMHDFAYCETKKDQMQVFANKSFSVEFPSREWTLSAKAKRDIEREFGHLAEIYFNDCIRLDGNTDSRGPHDYNVDLSKKRAEAVKQHLVEHYGFDERRIVTVGRGPDNPIATNATKAGRARNRRTDFELLH